MRRGAGSGFEAAVTWVFGAVLAGTLLHLALVAWRLPVDFWDGYEYLINARVLARHDVGRLAVGYRADRAPLVPLLVAPVLHWYAPGGEGTSLRGPHVLAVALSGLALLAMHRLLRQTFPSPEALLGCALLAMNPLFIHYAPFVMTDIPVILFLTVAGASYVRARRSGRWLTHLVAAAALALALLTRYTAVLAAAAFGLFEASTVLIGPRPPGSRPHGPGRRLWQLVTDVRPWVVGGGAFLIFYLAHVAVFVRVAPGSGNNFTRLVDLFRVQGQAHALPGDPTWEFASELAATFSLPVVAVALVGLLVAAARRTDLDLLCLAWFGTVFTLLTLLVAHKEARYAFPVVPPLVYLAVRGVQALPQLFTDAWGRVAGRPSRAPAELVFGLLIGLVAVRPVVLAVREHGRFHDPVYSTPFLPDVARWVLAHSRPGQRILFTNASGGLGFLYTMYPRDPVFLPYDEFYYFHHIGGPALAYLLDRPLELTAPLPAVHDDDLAPFVERFAASEVIVGSSGRFFDTAAAASVPEPPEPLTLTAVERRTFTRVEEGGAPDRVVYESSTEPPQRLILARRGEGWQVAGDGLDARWRLFARQPGGPATRFEPAGAQAPPAVLELVRVEQLERSYR